MNNICLDKISPKYFTPKTIDNESTIWQKQTNFLKGNYYLIIAPSGSGKSTLASAVFGNHFEYDGAVFYDDTNIKLLSLEKLVAYRKEKIQLLFQDVRLINDLTIRENIELRLFDNITNDSKNKIESYSETLGIKKILDKKAKNCSYGERQRAAIIRSLIKPTSFLIYDECFSHLDQNNKEIAFTLISNVAKTNNSGVLFFELNNFPFSHDFEILNL